jgi:hypothetical protein
MKEEKLREGKKKGGKEKRYNRRKKIRKTEKIATVVSSPIRIV